MLAPILVLAVMGCQEGDSANECWKADSRQMGSHFVRLPACSSLNVEPKDPLMPSRSGQLGVHGIDAENLEGSSEPAPTDKLSLQLAKLSLSGEKVARSDCTRRLRPNVSGTTTRET
jgi:hypothetical protein